MRNRNPNNWIPWLLLAVVLAGGWLMWPRPQALPPAPAGDTVHALPGNDIALPPMADASPSAKPVEAETALPVFLPAEAHATIAMIRRGGPFPHRQDGSVFGNREGHLPRQPRGWYREYTVETPGLRHRGTRRIVTGGDPPQAWYYTDDHYETFRRFDPGASRP